MVQVNETLLQDVKISFIGGGNMAQALISGLVSKGIKPNHITVADPSQATRQLLSEEGLNVIDPLGDSDTDNAEVAVKDADIVVLAVKPQVMQKVVAAFSGVLDKQLIVSVAAGLSTKSLSQMLDGYNNIVRAMPNTPAMIQEGATGLYADSYISERHKQMATAIMATAGLVIWVDDESKLHAVTAVSGSAPAYFFYMLESMIKAGVALGLDEKQAAALAMQTALGSAKMAICSDETPAILRQKVTSPNGTTHAAIESLKKDDFSDVIEQAMQACYDRSETLSLELGSLDVK